MLKGTTSTGFDFSIPDETLDDYELVEAIGDLEENPLRLTKVVDILLGKDEKKRLKEHCKVNGRVSAKRMEEEITEILTSNSESKN